MIKQLQNERNLYTSTIPSLARMKEAEFWITARPALRTAADMKYNKLSLNSYLKRAQVEMEEHIAEREEQRKEREKKK